MPNPCGLAAGFVFGFSDLFPIVTAHGRWGERYDHDSSQVRCVELGF